MDTYIASKTSHECSHQIAQD